MVNIVENPADIEPSDVNKIQTLTASGNLPCKSLDTLSLSSSASSISSSGSENLVSDGVLISPAELLDDSETRVNIINSNDVHLGNIYHNYGNVTIQKRLQIQDLDHESDQGNTAICDNSLGHTNESFVTDNNCDNQIKTAKLDDGLFIVSNKNIQLDECALNKLLVKKKTRNHRTVIVASLVAILACGFIVYVFKKTQDTHVPGIPPTETSRQLRHILLYVSAFACFLLAIGVIGSTLFFKSIFPVSKLWGYDTNEQAYNTPIDGTNNSISGPAKLRVITRLEWLAQPPTNETDKLNVPVPMVIIHHTATENCSTRAQCVFQCRQIQTYHIESYNWWDIGYNFLVGGDGLVYEGRGFYKEGAHTFSYNSKSIGIAFIGTFDRLKPPDIQIRAARRLIEKAASINVLIKDYQILGARQFGATVSPGQKLYDEIQTWPHWSSTVPIPAEK